MVQLQSPAVTAAAAAANKPLSINMDLLLYRCRLMRLQAQLCAELPERRQLLRDSEEGLRRALTLDSSDPRTYVVLGKLLLHQKRYDEARRLYADGTRNTGNTNPYIWAAWGYLESVTGNVARARKLFDAALVVDETHSAAWHKWGMLEMRQGNYLRARDLWTAGIQKCRRAPSKENCYLYCSLAIMAAELGKLAEARAWFEEGTRSNAGRASCALWHAWAMVEARIGDPTAVRYLFKQALAANPRSRYAHLAWAMWERRQGNARAAMQLLLRGRALNPADPALHQALGLAEKEAGRPDAARAHFRRGLAVDASHLQLWQAWGVMEVELGAVDEARRLFQQGVWADPGNKDVVYVFHAWGVLERRAGNGTLARELFKAALKVDPKNEATWGAWIDLEEEEGRMAAASELRIRRSEQQWECVIPSSFTTRPGEGAAAAAAGSAAGAAGSAASGVFGTVLNTISRFFRMRAGDAIAGGGGDAGDGFERPLHELLPDDFSATLSLEDIIDDAASIELPDDAVMAGSSAGGGAPAGGARRRGAPGGRAGGRAGEAGASASGAVRGQPGDGGGAAATGVAGAADTPLLLGSAGQGAKGRMQRLGAAIRRKELAAAAARPAGRREARQRGGAAVAEPSSSSGSGGSSSAALAPPGDTSAAAAAAGGSAGRESGQGE